MGFGDDPSECGKRLDGTENLCPDHMAKFKTERDRQGRGGRFPPGPRRRRSSTVRVRRAGLLILKCDGCRLIRTVGPPTIEPFTENGREYERVTYGDVTIILQGKVLQTRFKRQST